MVHFHHWREGNLPSSSKCYVCKKTCWSGDCLTGYKCEWCGVTVSHTEGNEGTKSFDLVDLLGLRLALERKGIEIM